MYSCDGKALFSAAISPVFSVTWSFWNHSNMLIWLGAQEIFIIISNIKNSCASILVETVMDFSHGFFGESLSRSLCVCVCVCVCVY